MLAKKRKKKKKGKYGKGKKRLKTQQGGKEAREVVEGGLGRSRWGTGSVKRITTPSFLARTSTAILRKLVLRYLLNFSLWRFA